jgi:peptide/nickel transport system permease protein
VLRRLAQIVPVVVLATAIVFGLLQLVPGDQAVTLAGENASVERIAEIRRIYGFDKPLVAQYGGWLARVATGDLSNSLFTRQPVAQIVAQKLPNTLLIVVFALAIAVALGVPLGLLAARRPGSAADMAVSALASLGLAVPNFWLGMILMSIFAMSLQWLPLIGAVPLSENPFESLRHALLPALALAASGVAEVARQLRVAMIEILRSQFVRALRAKGLDERAIFLRHGLRNAGLTLLTVVGLLFNRMLGATVVIEAVFAVPGIGSSVVEATINRDFPVVQGVVLVLVLLVIATNLAVDALYAVLDPRVRAR